MAWITLYKQNKRGGTDKNRISEGTTRYYELLNQGWSTTPPSGMSTSTSTQTGTTPTSTPAYTSPENAGFLTGAETRYQSNPYIAPAAQQNNAFTDTWNTQYTNTLGLGFTPPAPAATPTSTDLSKSTDDNAPIGSLSKLLRDYGISFTYNKDTGMVSVTNPQSGKVLSFKSGQGQEYGLTGLKNGYNMVGDPQVFLNALGYVNPAPGGATGGGATGGGCDNTVNVNDSLDKQSQNLINQTAEVNRRIQEAMNAQPSETYEQYRNRILAEINNTLEQQRLETMGGIEKARGGIATDKETAMRDLDVSYQKSLSDLASKADEIRAAYATSKRNLESTQAEQASNIQRSKEQVETAYNKGVRNVQAQREETLPQYESAKSQSDVQASRAAKNITDYLAKRGLAAGGQAVAEMANVENTRLTNLNTISQQETGFLRDIANKISGMEEERTSSLDELGRQQINFARDMANKAADLEQSQTVSLADIERLKGQAGLSVNATKQNIIDKVNTQLNNLTIDEKNLVEKLALIRQQMESNIETQYRNMTKEERDSAFSKAIQAAGISLQSIGTVKNIVDDFNEAQKVAKAEAAGIKLDKVTAEEWANFIKLPATDGLKYLTDNAQIIIDKIKPEAYSKMLSYAQEKAEAEETKAEERKQTTYNNNSASLEAKLSAMNPADALKYLQTNTNTLVNDAKTGVGSSNFARLLSKYEDTKTTQVQQTQNNNTAKLMAKLSAMTPEAALKYLQDNSSMLVTDTVNGIGASNLATILPDYEKRVSDKAKTAKTQAQEQTKAKQDNNAAALRSKLYSMTTDAAINYMNSNANTLINDANKGIGSKNYTELIDELKKIKDANDPNSVANKVKLRQIAVDEKNAETSEMNAETSRINATKKGSTGNTAEQQASYSYNYDDILKNQAKGDGAKAYEIALSESARLQTSMGTTLYKLMLDNFKDLATTQGNKNKPKLTIKDYYNTYNKRLNDPYTVPDKEAIRNEILYLPLSDEDVTYLLNALGLGV